MVEKLDLASLYASALPPRAREELLAQYCDYISLARNLENVVRRYRPARLASHEVNALYDRKEGIPWQVKDMTPEEKAAYDSFLANEPPVAGTHYCFVSLNCTSPRFKNDSLGIYSIPESFTTYNSSHSLPTRVERTVAAYRKGEKLEDARFLVAGRWKLVYSLNSGGKTLEEAFTEEKLQKGFDAIIDILTLLPEGMSGREEKEIGDAQTEALASAVTAPFENVILGVLAALSEESTSVLKKMLSRRAGSNFAAQAESEGLIRSASGLQDCLNIRHLMHHQWDTLDGLGRFNEKETVKNDSLRRRYMDSYCRICDRPMMGRMEAYIDAAREFTPLVTALNPNFFIRGENESNSKFVARLKEYARAFPDKPLLVETNYPSGSDKKDALIKNVSKLFPSARVIDRSDMDMEKFLERITAFLYRRNYLEVHQQVEYKMSQFCLFSGQNIQPGATLPYLQRRKILSPEEAVRWGEYRQLRNDLSHKYLDDGLLARLQEKFPEFVRLALDFDDKLEHIYPQVSLLRDNIYLAVHPDGRIVKLDYANRRILGVAFVRKGEDGKWDAAEIEKIILSGGTLPEKEAPAQSHPEKRVSASAGPSAKKPFPKKGAAPAHKTKRKGGSSGCTYIEEYQNGASVALVGTDVVSCRLPNGVLVNMRSRTMSYPDGSRLHFKPGEHYALSVKGGVKLITDRDFKVFNYILNGKSVSIAKNESAKFPNSHGFALDKNGFLSDEEFLAPGGKLVKISYKSGGGNAELRFSDGTVCRITPEKTVLSHRGIELSYATRKAFIESYGGQTELALQKLKTRRDDGR